MRLHENLVLASYLGTLLGDADGDTTAALRTVTEPGRRADGQTHYFSALEMRNGALGLSLDDLRRYDLNIAQHVETLTARRPDVKGLLYFQYLAALSTEILLDRFAHGQGQLLLDVEAHRAAHVADVPPVQAEHLRTWAFWMATGSGKTLLLHLAYLQFRHHAPFKADNLLLLTPGEGLTLQHLDEFAKSGIPAVHASDADAAFDGVQVIELTRLVDDTAPGAKLPKGGVSMLVSAFEGQNLVFVDEGHKGSLGTTKDRAEEGAWRTLRRLLGHDGLTLEYSATFGQVAAAVPGLGDEYARSIAFEYAYGRFHGDGYGKDYRVLNVKKDGDAHTHDLLLGGLLALYAQRRAYDRTRAALAPYHVAQPLLLFVGQKVTGGDDPEVLQLLRFLGTVLADRAGTVKRIERLVAGTSGLTGPDGQDAFVGALATLRGEAAASLYADLCDRIFHGAGRLQLVRLARTDGEVALRTSGARGDAAFGLLNVGDVDKLLKLAEDEGLDVAEPDAVQESLFDRLRADEGDVSILVGARKFSEGWSTARVSVMGLLNVGKQAGAQIIQLFGRGVRLFGKDRSLRRSAGTLGAPEALGLLETLHVFGVKADYMEQFLRTLGAEGAPTEALTFPIDVHTADVSRLKLRLFEKRSEALFSDEPPFAFAMASESGTVFPEAEVAYTPTVATVRNATVEAGKTDGFLPASLPLDEVDEEALFYHALQHKQRKGYTNLFVSRPAFRDFLRQGVKVRAPREVLSPRSPEQRRALNGLAEKAVRDGLDTYYGRFQRRFAAEQIGPAVLDEQHPNIPRDDTGVPAYKLKVAKDTVEQVRAIVDDARARAKEDGALPLPRLVVAPHVYAPLLSTESFELAGGKLVRHGGRTPVSISPAGLVQSEVQFLADLRRFWQAHHALPEWQGMEVVVLRNLPKTGLEFYDTAGFYPDFLLWLVHGERQALAFIDPKGMVHWASEKVRLLRFMETMSFADLPIRGFIVTPTAPADIFVPDTVTDRLAWLREQNVLLQSSAEYVADLLGTLRAALAP